MVATSRNFGCERSNGCDGVVNHINASTMHKPSAKQLKSTEITVDLFAGGGGASTGIEAAIGCNVDIAVNHDPEAIALHAANHPGTAHLVSDVFEVNPREVTQGRPVGLLWASPDCTFHSKARGGKPHRDRNRARRRRGLAWVVCQWARAVRPRVIALENVEEFQAWGPLREDGTPCPDRRGTTFQRWVAQLRNLGYDVQWRELRACDYGAPTIRKRLFVIARCDGEPICWPAPTHGKPGTLPVTQGRLEPWLTAADCIDWSIPCPSIFERKKPLADATCRRIAKGIMRYVVGTPEPFIVPMTHAGGDRVHAIAEPIRTVTTAHRGEFAVCVPTVAAIGTHQPGNSFGAGLGEPSQVVTIDAHTALAAPTLVETGYGERTGQAPRAPGLAKPLGTIVAGGGKHALVSAFLAKHYGGVVGHGVAQPVGTVTTTDHHSLVTATIVHYQADKRPADVRASDIREPLKTQTTENRHALVTSNLLKLRGDNVGSGTDEPLHTISAGGTHHAEVRAFLEKYQTSASDTRATNASQRGLTETLGVVTFQGERYIIVDIGLRMLTPRELFRAQGFPDSYVIERGGDGRSLSKTAQVRMCGNSVCPPIAAAIIRANYRASDPVLLAA